MLTELANRIKLWVNSKLLEKQDTLVSGTNIKTINSVSLLGSGNIETSHGDVAGPVSSVNNNIVAFDGTTGKQIKDSGVLYTDVLTNDLIGTDVQAYNTNLANISALSFSTGDILIDLGGGLDRLPIGADGEMLRVAGGILAYETPNFAPLFTNDATLTEATTSYDIADKNVRITINSGTTGSLNTIIDMATTNLVGEHFVVIHNNSGGVWTLTTTSLNNFVDGSYPIDDGTEVVFIVRRNLLTTTFNETTHIFVGNVGKPAVSGGGVSENVTSVTASTASSNSLNLTNIQNVVINLDANIDLESVIDTATIQTGRVYRIIAECGFIGKNVTCTTFNNAFSDSFSVSPNTNILFLIVKFDTKVHFLANDMSM